MNSLTTLDSSQRNCIFNSMQWQRRTDWRVGICVWAPGSLFGAIEECGKEGGNQREQRGMECDNKPSVLSGLWTTAVCGLALITAPLCGGQCGSFTSREAAALSCTLMPMDPGMSKGPSKRFFFIHYQTVSLFYFVTPCSTLLYLQIGGLFSSHWGNFSLEIGLRGIEEKNPIIFLLPPHFC